MTFFPFFFTYREQAPSVGGGERAAAPLQRRGLAQNGIIGLIYGNHYKRGTNNVKHPFHVSQEPQLPPTQTLQ